KALWDNRLYWAGSETASLASGDNGYLEGALAAAERVVKHILETHNSQ
ncbi:MAG: monoamine oxidase, partial [Pseudomonadales bacterium]